MDRRIQTRVINRTIDGMGVLIEKDASMVWWITVNVHALGTLGLLKIFDGFDAGGKLVWQVSPGYTRQHSFMPPIPCDQGIYILTGTHIDSYTIAWRPRSWPREMT